MRRKKWPTGGHVVIAVPDSGLFVKNGEIICGHTQVAMEVNEMPLFSRRKDAEAHAIGRAKDWEERKTPDDAHEWNFVVISVMVSER